MAIMKITAKYVFHPSNISKKLNSSLLEANEPTNIKKDIIAIKAAAE